MFPDLICKCCKSQLVNDTSFWSQGLRIVYFTELKGFAFVRWGLLRKTNVDEDESVHMIKGGGRLYDLVHLLFQSTLKVFVQ